MKKVSKTSGGNATPSNVVAGDRIVHDRFGLGTIAEITGAGADQKATVNFDNAGEKKLLLRFAKLTKV